MNNICKLDTNKSDFENTLIMLEQMMGLNAARKACEICWQKVERKKTF